MRRITPYAKSKLDLRFHHFGIVTIDIKDFLQNCDFLLKSKKHKYIIDNIQRCKLAFYKGLDGNLYEIIEPIDEKSPVYRFAKSGGGFHHICYSVKDLESWLDYFKKINSIIVSRCVPAVAFKNKKIAFLFIKYLGLIELKED